MYERLLDMCGVQGGTILAPFAGSGTDGIAAMRRGMRAVLIEREEEYIDMIKRRVANDNFKSGVAPPIASNDNAKDPSGATQVAGNGTQSIRHGELPKRSNLSKVVRRGLWAAPAVPANRHRTSPPTYHRVTYHPDSFQSLAPTARSTPPKSRLP